MGYVKPPYYLSAYSLAVKAGFKGSLEQWLASLQGRNVELRYQDRLVQWRYATAEGEPEDEWKVLFSSDEVSDQVVQATLNEAKGYANAAAESVSRAADCVRQAQEYEQDAYNEANEAYLSAQDAKESAEIAAVHGVHKGTDAPVTEAAIWVKDSPESSGFSLIGRKEIVKDGDTVDFSGLELSEFILFCSMTQGTADTNGNVKIFKNGQQIWAPWLSKIVSASEDRNMMVTGENRCGIAVLEVVPPAAATATQSRYPNRCPSYIEGNTPFTRIVISPSGGALLPVGCVFELWGKRDVSNILYRDVNGAYVPCTYAGASMEMSSLWAAIHDLQRKMLDYPVFLEGGNATPITAAMIGMSPKSLTEIAFVDSYKPIGVEESSCPMDVGGTGAITGYRIGNKLIIAGNGSGRIRLHANCRNLFGGLTALEMITGLELLDASGVTTFRGAFAMCRNLRQVDMSSWKVPCLTDMAGMFNFCDGLERAILPQYGIPATANTLMMFFECHALKTVSMGWGLTALSAQTFHRCLNLESVTGLSGVEEIGDFAFVYTPKVRTDLVPSKIHTLGASALRLSGMEDQKSFSAVPNVGQSATRQARWDADQLKAIRAVQLPDVHIDVPNPDSISRYTDIAYIGAEYTEDGQVGKISRYGCAAMTLYHIYQAHHAPLDDDMLYPNFEDFWYDAIDVERNWSTKGYDWNNHIYKMVEALGWRKSGQIEVIDASAKAKIGELLSAGKVVFVNMVSSRPDGTTHAVAVIGSDSATDKLEVLDSCNYDSASVHPWVSWMSFEDMFTQESVDVNPEGKPGKELIYLIEFTREE